MKIFFMNNKMYLSETRQYRTVFPDSLNSNSALFGGQVLKWMDELAFICASRLTHQRMFTVKSDKTRFLKPVLADSFVELVAGVVDFNKYKIQVRVEVYSEKILFPQREKVLESQFELVALNSENKLEALSIYKQEVL